MTPYDHYRTQKMVEEFFALREEGISANNYAGVLSHFLEELVAIIYLSEKGVYRDRLIDSVKDMCYKMKAIGRLRPSGDANSAVAKRITDLLEFQDPLASEEDLSRHP